MMAQYSHMPTYAYLTYGNRTINTFFMPPCPHINAIPTPQTRHTHMPPIALIPLMPTVAMLANTLALLPPHTHTPEIWVL